MAYIKDISIIIPHRDSVELLKKLFNSIPVRDNIEIILVDNSPNKITKADIGLSREYSLIYSDPQRGAGGARNVGIEHSNGKWLLFADADDFYAPNAFDVFYSKIDSDSDIIYTCMGGIYLDTGEPSNRGGEYAKMVHEYCTGEATDRLLRYGFSSPCCKMIRHDLVERHALRFDEIKASNDVYFSITSGFYAKKIEAVDVITYIATVNRGSLTQRRDYDVISARLFAALHCNSFLKQNGLRQYQRSIMRSLYEARSFSFSQKFRLLQMIFKYRQNPFVGSTRWVKSFFELRKKDKKDRKYIVK